MWGAIVSMSRLLLRPMNTSFTNCVGKSAAVLIGGLHM